MQSLYFQKFKYGYQIDWPDRRKISISREDCAYINNYTFYELYSSANDVKSKLLTSVEQGKSIYEMTRAITLPSVITKSDDVYCFFIRIRNPII